MSDVNLLPVDGMGGGFGTGGAAALGAFVGSWFGNGTGGWPNNRNATVAGDTILMDSIGTLQASVNSANMALVQGQGTANVVAAQGFGGVNSTVLQTGASAQNTMAQGFAGLNTAVYQGSVDTRFAINDLARQSAECCCEVKTAILTDGAATRQLIQNNLITELQTQLCDSKTKAAQLETQAYLCASQNAQTQQIISTVLAHLPHPK